MAYGTALFVNPKRKRKKARKGKARRKCRRTAAQVRATKKLVAFMKKKRRSSKRRKPGHLGEYLNPKKKRRRRRKATKVRRRRRKANPALMAVNPRRKRRRRRKHATKVRRRRRRNPKGVFKMAKRRRRRRHHAPKHHRRRRHRRNPARKRVKGFRKVRRKTYFRNPSFGSAIAMLKKNGPGAVIAAALDLYAVEPLIARFGGVVPTMLHPLLKVVAGIGAGALAGKVKMGKHADAIMTSFTAFAARDAIASFTSHPEAQVKELGRMAGLGYLQAPPSGASYGYLQSPPSGASLGEMPMVYEDTDAV